MKKIAGVSLYFLTEAEGGQKGLITEDFSTPVIFDVDQDLIFGLMISRRRRDNETIPSP